MEDKKLKLAKINFRILSITNILLGLFGTKLIIEMNRMQNPGLGGFGVLAIVMAQILFSIVLSIASYKIYRHIENTQKMLPFDTFLVLVSVFYPGLVNFIFMTAS